MALSPTNSSFSAVRASRPVIMIEIGQPSYTQAAAELTGTGPEFFLIHEAKNRYRGLLRRIRRRLCYTECKG